MAITTVSERSLNELQDMLRWWRQIIRRTDPPPPPPTPGPYYTRWFRTQGDNPASLSDATYPTQVDGDGARLPGIFLTVVYDDAAADPVTFDTVNDGSKNYIYSPGGWIPRLMDLRVSFRGGYWVPDFVPCIPVRLDAGVTAPDDVAVEIINSGTMDTQTFTAHLDFMAGTVAGTTNEECFAWLNERTKRWDLVNKECPA